MSLLTYEETRPWAKSIRAAVLNREMPPWHADPNIGKFTNDISLSEEEIDTIVRWVDSGAPKGNPENMPEVKDWEAEGIWFGGEPDLILKPERAFSVRWTEEKEDIYQCFVLPTGLTEDTWIQGIELIPGGRSRGPPFTGIHRQCRPYTTSGRRHARTGLSVRYVRHRRPV